MAFDLEYIELWTIKHNHVLLYKFFIKKNCIFKYKYNIICVYFVKPMNKTISFSNYLDNVSKPNTYDQSAALLSDVLKKNFLSLTEFKEDPMKFFKFHEIVAQKDGFEGFGIRFTVQYNLFAGTILQLGTPEQIQLLDEIQKNGDIGCFMLTENDAGVLSGFKINTTCYKHKKDDCYIINTNKINIDMFENKNRKTWISQGLTAKYGLIIAKSNNKNTSDNIGVFLVDLSSDGIYRKDIGNKTGINSLDNAEFVFDNLKVQKDNLIGNRFWNFNLISQRLLSGRLCIAFASLVYFKNRLNGVMPILNNVTVWVSGEEKIPMKDLYHINYFLNDANNKLEKYTHFIEYVKIKYCKCILENKIPNDELIELILIAKVICTNFALDYTLQLKKIIGSRALLEKNGFGQNLDILYCCLFAEGDNKILQQKITRDQIKLTMNNKYKIIMLVNYVISKLYNDYYYKSHKVLIDLIWQMKDTKKEDYGKKWNENIDKVNLFAKYWSKYKIDTIYLQSNL